jgi:rifampicin phosphotransferase
MLGAAPSETALVTGSPASAGTASGPVRVVRGPHEFDTLQPGEVLVAPLTAPAWTPLFTRAAAVVTDVGSPASHASIIAREYGIPAVVGCGDATARLSTGLRVTVDGGTGNVEPA